MNPFLVASAALFGLMVGSFLNVVIYRLPRGQSVIKPRSYCPRCSRKLAWYENIPVLSYLFLRCKCSGCGSRIPISYPIVELIGGGLAVLVLSRFGPAIDVIFVYAFLMALLAITVIDWNHRVIPDEISLPFILAGLGWSFFNPDLNPLESALGIIAGGGGLYIVGAVYRILRHTEGMGGGDVKLMAMIGAFLGVKFILPVILIASFFGSVYGLALLRSGKGGKAVVAFGSFLAPAAGLCMFAGTSLIAWYIGHF